MAIDVNGAIQKIKAVGATNVRMLPMLGQNIQEGDYQIEVKDGTAWLPIVTGVKRTLAEQIIGQALNRTICG